MALCLIPEAAAQTPVTECRAECRPAEGDPTKATDPDTTTEVFLYGHAQSWLLGGLLTTQFPSPELNPPRQEGYLLPTIFTGTGTPADFQLRHSFNLNPSVSRLFVREDSMYSGGIGSFGPLKLDDDPIRFYG